MARPTSLDLTATEHPWRPVPMHGANRGIEVVPLASHPTEFVILARFPAGFSRDEPGGYHAAETFLVLEGELDLDGRALGRGDLTHVPAETLRVSMGTSRGCTALAWFSGEATFLSPAELGETRREMISVPVIGATGTVLQTPEADWEITSGASAEGVSLDLTRWALDGSALANPCLTRRRHEHGTA